MSVEAFVRDRPQKAAKVIGLKTARCFDSPTHTAVPALAPATPSIQSASTHQASPSIGRAAASPASAFSLCALRTSGLPQLFTRRLFPFLPFPAPFPFGPVMLPLPPTAAPAALVVAAATFDWSTSGLQKKYCSSSGARGAAAPRGDRLLLVVK